MALVTLPIRFVYFVFIGWWLGTIWLLVVLVVTLGVGLLGIGLTDRLWVSVPIAYTLARPKEPAAPVTWDDDRLRRDRRPTREMCVRRQPRSGFPPLFIVVLIVVAVLLVAVF